MTRWSSLFTVVLVVAGCESRIDVDCGSLSEGACADEAVCAWSSDSNGGECVAYCDPEAPICPTGRQCKLRSYGDGAGHSGGPMGPPEYLCVSEGAGE